MVPIFRPWRWAKATRSGMRAMVPSSFMISQMTPAGKRPARRARSTVASVWPARTSTPPSRAISGKTWPGRDDVVEVLGGVDGGGDGAGAVVGGDAGGDALARLDGDGEGRAVARLVLARHVLEAELARALLGQRQADEAAAVLGHEVDGVGRGHLRGDDEVALVFAVLGVHQDDHAAVAQILEISSMGDRKPLPSA